MIDGKLPTRGLVYAALFGAMTAAGALIVIPLPPVPVTAQTFFMNVAALLLGGPLAVVSQIIYVLRGVVGMPDFAGGKAAALFEANRRLSIRFYHCRFVSAMSIA